MRDLGSRDGHIVPGVDQFNTTHWSVVLRAGERQEPAAQDALEEICRTYWPPLYCYVRRQGYSVHDSQDLTQEFFARFLEKNYLQLGSRERGRFRSFLLKSLQHFIVNEWARGHTQKRGGGRVISLNQEEAERSEAWEPPGELPPEAAYDKRWAVTLLERSIERLGERYAAAGKRELFCHLKGLLLTETSGEAYGEIARKLGLSEGAVKVAVHRLRQRFREVVREEVAKTVASPTDVDEELRCLMASLSA